MQPNEHQTKPGKPSLASQVYLAVIGSMQSCRDMQTHVERRYH